MFDRTDKDLGSPTNHYTFGHLNNNPFKPSSDYERIRDHSGSTSLKINIKNEIKSDSAESNQSEENQPPNVLSPKGARTTKNNRARRRMKSNYETNP